MPSFGCWTQVWSVLMIDDKPTEADAILFQSDVDSIVID